MYVEFFLTILKCYVIKKRHVIGDVPCAAQYPHMMEAGGPLIKTCF